VNQGKLNAIAATGTEVGLLAPGKWKLEWNRTLNLEALPKAPALPGNRVVFRASGAYFS